MTVSVHEVRPPTEGKKQVLCPVDYKVSLSFPSASFAFRSSFPRNELGFTLPEKVFRLNTGDPEIILKEVQALWVVETLFFPPFVFISSNIFTGDVFPKSDKVHQEGSLLFLACWTKSSSLGYGLERFFCLSFSQERGS